MLSKYSKIQFPLWQYLNQPLFEDHSRTVLDPYRFWFRYRIELLERCLMQACAPKDSRRD